LGQIRWVAIGAGITALLVNRQIGRDPDPFIRDQMLPATFNRIVRSVHSDPLEPRRMRAFRARRCGAPMLPVRILFVCGRTVIDQGETALTRSSGRQRPCSVAGRASPSPPRTTGPIVLSKVPLRLKDLVPTPRGSFPRPAVRRSKDVDCWPVSSSASGVGGDADTARTSQIGRV
jgi:hypothetical protein